MKATRSKPTKARRATDAPGKHEARGGAPLPPDPSTATSLKLYVVLSRATASVQELSRQNVRGHGIGDTEFGILEALYHKGPLLLGDLQRKILVSSGGITFLVDRLAKRGLVERRACETDRRARYAALTEKGEALMRDIFPGHAVAIREAMSELGVSDQRALTTLLRRLGRSAADKAAAHPACREALSGG